MIILVHGVEQPTTGDRGSVFFPALEHLCQKFATHTHDGVDSYAISSAYNTPGTAVAAAGSWVLSVNGLYSQNVNLPANFDYDNSQIEVRDDTSGEVILAEYIKVSATVMTVFAGTNTLDYRIIFK